MITAKIDVTKIEKGRLFKGKNDKLWLDVVLIPTPNNQYGDDYMVVQSVSETERKAGVKGPILGNARKLDRDRGGRATPPASEVEVVEPDAQGDIPF